VIERALDPRLQRHEPSGGALRWRRW
jgi:hypothetical protein